jgi:hypothetical protein
MKRTLFLVLAVAIVGSAGSRAEAQDATIQFQDRAQLMFRATYVGSQTHIIDGHIVWVALRDPLDSFIHIDGLDEHGRMQRWAVEWVPARQLSEMGATSATLHLCDRVIITGNPGRYRESLRLYTRSILRTLDGWRWGGSFD